MLTSVNSDVNYTMVPVRPIDFGLRPLPKKYKTFIVDRRKKKCFTVNAQNALHQIDYNTFVTTQHLKNSFQQSYKYKSIKLSTRKKKEERTAFVIYFDFVY